ncbi:DUF4214 domain-containing protein [Pseudomonas sp. MAG002Y]|uniref:DUF4214 domain-containing protein n=1 Tax=Pseudomonas sp. MAG002Y TaxID=2678690 RepID=UPI001C60891C|nr:DUF4214 domain-containing protein [Pseudomonas sp. MAG002Y]MBW5413096.1 DUF4214 domain-containing protein [Pseudomonas sp. MAG002Y]
MAVTANQVQELYLAYFGRPAEQAGLTYWTADANATVEGISASFVQQPEYTDVYGGLTRAQLIQNLYQNLFGRNADSADLAYWNNSTDVTPDQLALALVNGALGTDRLLLDNKVQYAQVVTAQQGPEGTAAGVADFYSAQEVNGQTLQEYVTANTSASVTASQAAAQFFSLATTAANAAVTPVITGNTATDVTVNFQALTTGTITLDRAAGTHTATLDAANAATDLTVKGSISAAESLKIVESTTDDSVVTTLHVNASSSAAANATAADKTLTLDVTDLDALTSIDGAASTANLNLGDLSGLASLANVTTGAGADTLTVATTATDAVALTVDTGAGNDTVTATVGTAALTVNTGAGNDTINATTGGAALVINAGAGNDIVNLTAVTAGNDVTAAHTTTITLGDGADVLNVLSLANLGGKDGAFAVDTAAHITAANAAVAEDLVTVTDFNGSQDRLVLSSGYTALNNTQNAAVTGAASLAEALNVAAGFANGSSTAFQFGGNTYVFTDGGTAGSLSSGDGVIELTGFTGQLTDANFAHA